MVADLRKMQENQGVSENRIDKLGFSVVKQTPHIWVHICSARLPL